MPLLLLMLLLLTALVTTTAAAAAAALPEADALRVAIAEWTTRRDEARARRDAAERGVAMRTARAEGAERAQRDAAARVAAQWRERERTVQRCVELHDARCLDGADDVVRAALYDVWDEQRAWRREWMEAYADADADGGGSS